MVCKRSGGDGVFPKGRITVDQKFFLPYLVSVLQQFNSRTRDLRFGSQTGGTFGKLYSKSLLLCRL